MPGIAGISPSSASPPMLEAIDRAEPTSAPYSSSMMRSASSSTASRFSATRTMAAPTRRSSTSPTLCAASVLASSVRWPSAASLSALAAATLVLPTPPFPVKIRMRAMPRPSFLMRIILYSNYWAEKSGRLGRAVRACSRPASLDGDAPRCALPRRRFPALARLLREQSGGAKGFLQAFQLVIGNDAAFVNWLFFLK